MKSPNLSLETSAPRRLTCHACAPRTERQFPHKVTICIHCPNSGTAGIINVTVLLHLRDSGALSSAVLRGQSTFPSVNGFTRVIWGTVEKPSQSKLACFFLWIQWAPLTPRKYLMAPTSASLVQMFVYVCQIPQNWSFGPLPTQKPP